MTCRCSTKEEHAQRAVDQENWSAQNQHEATVRSTEAARVAAESRLRELQERSPDPDRFAIDDIEQVGKHLVVRVEYPGCRACSYDRRKVMVFLNVTVKDAIKWRRIDPHFRELTHRSTMPAGQVEAPSPAARFPGSADGWGDAMAYAQRTTR